MSAKIYKLENNKGQIYIGSTKSNLEKRLNNHKYAFACYIKNKGKYYSALDIFKTDGEVKIHLLEDLGNVNRYNMLSKERQYIEENKCINKNTRPVITEDEKKLYLQTYRIQQLNNEYNKKYYIENKDKFKKYYEEQKEHISAQKKLYYQRKKKEKKEKEAIHQENLNKEN